MYSNKDYEKLWQKYQTEGIAKNMTLQMFCSMNNVPYNSFEKYLKTRRSMSDIHPVSITDLPEDGNPAPGIWRGKGRPEGRPRRPAPTRTPS